MAVALNERLGVCVCAGVPSTLRLGWLTHLCTARQVACSLGLPQRLRASPCCLCFLHGTGRVLRTGTPGTQHGTTCTQYIVNSLQS